jgi:hypothetical protein
VEVKRGSGQGLWHPHVHVLLVCSGWLDWGAVQRAWVKASNGESKHARVVQLTADQRRDKGLYGGDDERYRAQLSHDLTEIIKYPLKFPEEPTAEVFEVALQLKRQHMLRPFGNLYDVPVDESLLDPPLNWDELQWIDRWFRYCVADGAYREQAAALGELSRLHGEQQDAMQAVSRPGGRMWPLESNGQGGRT